MYYKKRKKYIPKANSFEKYVNIMALYYTNNYSSFIAKDFSDDKKRELAKIRINQFAKGKSAYMSSSQRSLANKVIDFWDNSTSKKKTKQKIVYKRGLSAFELYKEARRKGTYRRKPSTLLQRWLKESKAGGNK